MLLTIQKFGIFINTQSANVTLPDPKDLPFYEAALACQNNMTYLITGNIKHFPKDPWIVTPREFLNLLENR